MSSENKNTAVVASKPLQMEVGSRGIEIRDVDGLWRVAQYIAVSGMAPKGMEKPEALFVAIQLGLELGLTPMAAVQNIAPINGRPSVWGDAQLAIVRGSGAMECFFEEETNDELHPLFVDLCTEPDEAKARELRRDFSRRQAKMKKNTEDYGFSVCVLRTGDAMRFGRFTIADAKTAGLWGKTGPWTQYPQRMLKARARSFLLRDVFGDALKGIMAVEEAQDLPAEERFKTAKPAKIQESAATPLPRVNREKAAEVKAEPKKTPIVDVPVEASPEAKAKPAQATAPAETPVQRITSLIAAEGIDELSFVAYAAETFQLNGVTSIEEIAEVSPKKLERLIESFPTYKDALKAATAKQ